MSTRDEMLDDARRDAAEDQERWDRLAREARRTPEDGPAIVVCPHGNELSAFWGPCAECEAEDET